MHISLLLLVHLGLLSNGGREAEFDSWAGHRWAAAVLHVLLERLFARRYYAASREFGTHFVTV